MRQKHTALIFHYLASFQALYSCAQWTEVSETLFYARFVEARKLNTQWRGAEPKTINHFETRED